MAFEEYLKSNGFHEKAIECVCPHCVTVAEFLRTHPRGRYILMCQDRIVPVAEGACFDSINSLDEIVIYYYEGESANVPNESV